MGYYGKKLELKYQPGGRGYDKAREEFVSALNQQTFVKDFGKKS